MAVLAPCMPLEAAAGVLFQEDFEDSNLSSRGWFDTAGASISTTEHAAGSTASFECAFLAGATTCNGGTPGRHAFTETDSVYISYYVKYSSNWVGSNLSYHPHEFLFITNIDSQWIGPSRTHLTAYVEQNEGKPRLQITDALNINTGSVNQDIVNTTEERAVSGCNGDSDGYGGDCWACSGGYCNEKIWSSQDVYFQDTAGQYYKNDWHKVEAYFKLNSISNGKGVADGVVQYWFDGKQVINHTDVMFRTAQHPSMKFNHLLITPYIGDGSPVAQTMWVDNLTVSTNRAGSTAPSPPTNLKAY